MNLRYRLKRALQAPYITVQRWRYRHLDRLSRSIIEQHAYSGDIFSFCKDNVDNQLLTIFEQLHSTSTVLDVGGFEGDWAYQISSHYQCSLHVFEPQPSALKNLQKRFSGNPRVMIHGYGLSGQTRNARLSLRGPGAAIDDVHAGQFPSASIVLKDVEQVFEQLQLAEVDLIKINIEGGEYPLLKRMLECGLLNRCKVVLVQYHEWCPGSLSNRREIRREMAKSFSLDWDYPFIWEKWTRSPIQK